MQSIFSMIITLNSNIILLQQIRLIQALSESDFKVSVDKSDQYKLEPIIKKFNAEFITDKPNGLDFRKITNIDHSVPVSSIGGLNRTLIFPRYICYYLRDNWKSKRKLEFSFSGLTTAKRKSVLRQWVDNNRNRNLVVSFNRKLPIRHSLRYLVRFKNLISTSKKLLVEINFSSKGREFPKKTWDSEYYDTLLNSKFVLCPSGDYIWTYRFFECILAGAIPVIEAECEAYKGFRYRFMHEDIKDFKWEKEDAEYNYSLCFSKITIPLEQLNTELYRLNKKYGATKTEVLN